MTVPLSLTDLAGMWRSEELTLRIPDHGALALDLWTLHRFRGALGHALAKGASDQALRDEPCPFLPPCGYALFHGKVDWGRQVSEDRPLVLWADEVDGDLVLGLRLIGRATEWAQEYLGAMVAAARAGLDDGQGNRPALPVVMAERWPGRLAQVPIGGRGLALRFLTPVVQKDGGHPNARLNLVSLVSGLLRRIDQMAAVHGIETHWTRPMIAALAQDVAAGARDLTLPSPFPRGRTEGRLRAAHQGDILFPPVRDAATAAFWSLAMSCHVGADTAGGAGRCFAVGV